MNKEQKEKNCTEKDSKLINEYVPLPVDTGNVHLPEAMEILVEELAKNVHEVWARARISQGWKYGPTRNDELKTHPGLVPYEELSENEKDYDRATSQETLKLIIKLGFKIIHQ